MFNQRSQAKVICSLWSFLKTHDLLLWLSIWVWRSSPVITVWLSSMTHRPFRICFCLLHKRTFLKPYSLRKGLLNNSFPNKLNAKRVVQWRAIFRVGWYLRVHAAHVHWLQGSHDTRHPAAWSAAQHYDPASIGGEAKGGGHQLSLFIVWGPCPWKPQVYIGSEGLFTMPDFKPG